MEEYKKKFDETMDKLDSYLSSVPYIEKIEETLKLRRCYLALILAINVVLALFFSLGPKSVGNLIVFVFPAYMSLMTIKTEDKESHTQWLTYWIIYGISCVLESTEIIVRKVPYFSIIRFVFLVLCFLPNVKLAESIYMFYVNKKTSDNIVGTTLTIFIVCLNSYVIVSFVIIFLFYRLSLLRNKVIPVTYRSLLRVTGKDAKILLQGIASNDFVRNKNTFFFSTFMNPKGKLFSDSLVSIHSDNEILLDVPKEYLQNVKKLINFSLLRLDASVSEANELNVLASVENTDFSTLKDSRFSDYSVYRKYSEEKSAFQADTPIYKSFELLNGIWSAEDNIKNLHAGTVNLDLLQGASRTKGCYVGQEVYNSYVTHHKTPTRIVPVLLNLKSNELVLTKRAACEDLESDVFYSQEYSAYVHKPIKEGEKEVGTLLFVQPETCIGLALCENYQPPQGRWSVESLPVTPIV